MRLRNH